MHPNRLVILAPHEPWKDPRVHWAATSAVAAGHEVTVLGIRESGSDHPSRDSTAPYRILRGPATPGDRALVWHTWHSLGLVLGRTGRLAAIALGAALFVPVLILEWLWVLVASTLRRTVSGRTLAVAATVVRARLARTRGPGSCAGWQITFWNFQAYSARAGAALVRLYNTHLAPGPAVFHACDLQSLVAGIALKERHGGRLVYDAHELWPAVFPATRPWSARAIRVVERRLLRRVDDVVTVSPPLASIMQRWYGLTHVRVVPNATLRLAESGHAVRRVPARPRDPRLAEAAHGRRIFLFQGGLAEERGLEELIQAWRQVDSVRALLAIRGVGDAYRDALVSQARDQVEAGRIVFLEPVGEDQLVDAAAQAHVGLVPYRPVNLNHRGCCPNKLSQYLQAGLAILTNRLDYVQAMVEDHDLGLAYDSDDPASLAAAVTRFLDEPGFLHHCRKNARAFFRERFHWEAVCGPLLDAYRGVSAGDRPHRQTAARREEGARA